MSFEQCPKLGGESKKEEKGLTRADTPKSKRELIGGGKKLFELSNEEIAKLSDEEMEELSTTPDKRERTPEEIEERFFDDLSGDLKRVATRKIESKEVDDLMEEEGANLSNKVHQLFKLFEAEDIENIHTRESLFKKVDKIFSKRAGEEVLNAFGEANLMSAKPEEVEERRKELAKRIMEVEKKYNLRGLFEYLNLGEDKGGSFDLE
ncbi:MAG: hypothetical protein U9P90_00205 [Patescibacteria group bacterium]|nr:hypothetical protein [Patescibacteria group bacterium]